MRMRCPNPAGGPAPLVPLRELVKIERTVTDKSIYHKNLMPVTYVIGDVAGVIESPVYAILKMNKALRGWMRGVVAEAGRRLAVPNPQSEPPHPTGIGIYNAVLPFTDQQPALKWDGEWHITIEVFS